MKIFIVLFLVLSISFPAIAQVSQEFLKKALTAYEEKDFKIAGAHFEKYFPASDLLKDYVLFWWADSLKETGKENDAISVYQKVPHDSPIRKKAVEELIILCKKKGDWVSSINLVKEKVTLEKDKKIEPLWQREAVEIGYLSGSRNLAIDNFRRLLEWFPETKEALESLEKYGYFYSFKNDELIKAKVYLKHKRFKKVLESLGGFESCSVQAKGGREFLELKAEACCGLKDYKQAISILEELVKEKDEEELKFRLAEIYLLSAWDDPSTSAQDKSLRTGKGLAILEELTRDKQGSRIACLSLWKLLNYWKRKDEEEKTKIYCEKLREGYRQFSLTGKAIWIEGWMNMSKKNYIEADRAWQTFDAIPRNSREKLSALYIRRWIKLSSNNNSDAKKIFQKLARLYPDTYYGLEASKGQRIKDFSIKVELEALGEESDFDRTRALLELGRNEEAIFELEALREKRYNDINLRYNLSLIYGRADKFNKAVNEAASLVDYLKETGKWCGFLHLSEKKFLEINFPRFYRKEVERMAREFKLDENLIYAVMREESRFNEKDVSNSGAIGLMQIIPSTGKWIVEKNNLKDITMEDFFKPELNIFLGSWYLRYLLDKFNGDLLLAIASYNGGPGLIERWVKTGGLNNRDIAIEMMPREETKYYCQKVLFSYHMYGKIYPAPRRIEGSGK